MGWDEVTIGGCRLICGLAEEVLPTLGMCDAVVTDPPYEGLRGGTQLKWHGVAKRNHPTMTVGKELGTPEGAQFIQKIARYGAIVFCSHHCVDSTILRLGGKRVALLSWYKRNSPPPVNNVPWQCVELAWAVQYAPGITWSGLRTHLDFPMLHAGCFPGERLVLNGKALHPTQKPLALMHALLLPGMQLVCDPYMGLATTAIACIKTGRSFVGIEKEPYYFDIACRRVEAAYAQPDLFVPPQPAPPQQMALV
jgi:hypothetical protein